MPQSSASDRNPGRFLLTVSLLENAIFLLERLCSVAMAHVYDLYGATQDRFRLSVFLVFFFYIVDVDGLCSDVVFQEIKVLYAISFL